MSKFKNGDLVIDYEGDLTLMVETSERVLIPITLTGRRDVTRPNYYDTILKTADMFEEYHREHDYKYEVVGNLSEALKNLHVKIPK